jgi:hypothetical protein
VLKVSNAKFQHYINNFRRWVTPTLRPGIGMQCFVRPTADEGAVLEFVFNENVENDDKYFPVTKTLNDALRQVTQSAFTGNLDAYQFSGTNTLLESGRIILIKDSEPSLWTDTAARNDVTNMLAGRHRRRP